MRNAGLPPPRFSPPELDRVTCTLLNNLDERLKARTDLATQARIAPTTVTSNIYPLHLRSFSTTEPDAPFPEEPGRPTFGEIRQTLHEALRAVNFRVDSFTGVTAVNFADEYVIPALSASKTAAIYPGIAFRLLELHRTFYLVLDHTVEVRNRVHAKKIMRCLPWLRLGNHRRCFVRRGTEWLPGFIIAVRHDSCQIELKKKGHVLPETVEVEAGRVIPNLSTTELTALLQAEGAHVQLVQEVRKAALAAAQDAPRRRLERVQDIAETLSTRVFPLVIGAHEVLLAPTPVAMNQTPVHMGRKLYEPKAQFDRQGFRQDQDILRGLTTFRSFEKPQVEVPLVLVCPASWASQLHAFISRLRQGHQRYRGAEITFGVRFGAVTTLIAEVPEYAGKVTEALAQLPRDARPTFIVFTPERGLSRANYETPYYRLKRLLLEAGYPSQMVKEDTLEQPDWKDVNFALDVFVKSGFVPWVLSEGMPNADLFIGLSSSLITHGRQRQRLIGCKYSGNPSLPSEKTGLSKKSWYNLAHGKYAATTHLHL